MNNTCKMEIGLEKLTFDIYAEPPEDPLGEFSDFEMALRRFFFECNHLVLWKIGGEKIPVFLEPDICLIWERLPLQITELSQGKKIEIVFAESYCIIIKLVPVDSKITCTLSKFGTSCWEKHFEFDRTHVLDALRGFLAEVMQLAVDKGFITAEEKDEFIGPAFSGNTDAVVLSK
ncbi:hypothetical protein C7B67_17275 [filamentous cyanobacterium Phorm 6]|nr:hypothetical protein C7B67_17275 [filamentous cyanobacterium Phorm 6]